MSLPDDDDPGIPPSLQKKWDDKERVGLKAGVCPNCGWTVDEDALACPHCETPVEPQEGVLRLLKNFITSPMGVVLVLTLVAAFAALAIL